MFLSKPRIHIEWESNKIYIFQPNRMFSFSMEELSYGETKDGFQFSVDLLIEVNEVSEDILDVPLSARLQDLIPHPEKPWTYFCI